ncbi:MAG TPA: thioredoxin [Gemmatimonadaceae bacterium]|nr:thioredoxin [Gemmatimonadaceae bacterium]
MTSPTNSTAAPQAALGVVRCPFCGALTSADLAAGAPSCSACERPVLIDRPMPVTDADFHKIVAESTLPVLVDFYADWCAPCRMMAPVLDEMARDRKGRLQILKLDTDRFPSVSAGLGIRGIPTLILFKNGKEAGRQVGAAPRAMIQKMIDNS